MCQEILQACAVLLAGLALSNSESYRMGIPVAVQAWGMDLRWLTRNAVTLY